MNKTPSIDPKKTPTFLVGQWFHSIKDGRIHWQGQIIGSPEPGWYLVQLFEWLGGSPNVQRITQLYEMADWLFYDSADDMRKSWDHGVAKDGGIYRPTP